MNSSSLNTPVAQPLSKGYALLCLVVLGVVFYATYGFANWFSGQRAPLPEIVFAWERALPFWAWTIVPYWSLNLFYAASVFVCKDRAELYGLIKQLLIAQAIAITCFLLFPLQFTWAKPESSGISGALFQALAGFDQPYNQAPSLHIILVMLIGHFYYVRFPKVLRTSWLIWLLLIACSVLTTYQHHFIDIPSGAMVGALILWAAPINGSPIWRLTKPIHAHPKIARYYVLGALACIALACLAFVTSVGYFLWLFWGALSCTLVALIYARLGSSGFRKRADGGMDFATRLLFTPYLLGVRLNMWYWLRNTPKAVVITEQVWVGSILAHADFDAILDVCAEYPCAAPPAHYTLVPLLDMVSPSIEDLRHAASQLQALLIDAPKTLVCCALGYSRSVSVIIVWLVRFQHCANVDTALALLKQARPQMVLSPSTLDLLRRAAQ